MLAFDPISPFLAVWLGIAVMATKTSLGDDESGSSGFDRPNCAECGVPDSGDAEGLREEAAVSASGGAFEGGRKTAFGGGEWDDDEGDAGGDDDGDAAGSEPDDRASFADFTRLST